MTTGTLLIDPADLRAIDAEVEAQAWQVWEEERDYAEDYADYLDELLRVHE